MIRENLIEGRKRLQEAGLDDDADFKVGTIAGLEEVKEDHGGKKVRHLNKKQSKGDEPVIGNSIKETNPISPEQLEGTVELKIRKQYYPLVQVIVNNNDNVIVQEFEKYFQLNAKQIRVTRQDGERALGKMNDGQWRMLFMNKKGDVDTFNDHEFVLGLVE